MRILLYSQCLLLVNLVILIVSTDAIELTDYDVYDSLEEEETPGASVGESVRLDVTRRRQTQSTRGGGGGGKEETRQARRPDQVSSGSSGERKHQLDAGHKFITRKRSLQPIGQSNSITEQLFCMRTSRSNCPSNEQRSPGGMVITQLRAASVWHCLSTSDSPACVCTCDGSCEPAIVKIKSTVQSSSRQQQPQQPQQQASIGPSEGEMDRERPCDDCSCLMASIGSCFCSPGCG